MKKQITFLWFLVFGFFSMTTAFSQPGFTNLYLVGNATPVGWNIGAPEPMVQSLDNSNLFTWEGQLLAGELKISAFKGDWCDGSWIKSSQPNQTITATDFIYTFGCEEPDNKWLIAAEEAGRYKITIDLLAETIIFEKLSTDASLSSISVSVGILSPMFKGSVTEYTVSVPNGTTSVEISAGSNDLFANVSGTGIIDVSSGSGKATITVTAADGVTFLVYTVNIVAREPYFSNLYLIGSATPNGWNIGTPAPMIQNESDTMVFTWEGSLIAGEFKFSTFMGDWCGGIWIKASQPDQVLFATDFIYTAGCDEPDNKWLVSTETEGYYMIRVNLRNKTISIGNQMHDTELSSLSVNAGTLSPSFDGLINDYSVVLPSGTTSVNVTAIARSSGAAVGGDGVVDVTSGSGIATIKVTAPDEYLTRTYTINFSIATYVKNSEKFRTSVYPNPASEILYVNLGDESKADISICSIDGREVYRTILNENISGINLNTLNASGFVFVKVNTARGIEVYKIVLK